MIAKETRKVDELYCHLVLAQKLLKGTKKYMTLSEIVEKAVKSLETEFCGPLIGLPSAMCRGIVNRLSSELEVKNYCSSALKSLKDTSLDDLLMTSKMQGSTKIRFKDVRATTLTLILGSKKTTSSGNIIHHSIWHCKVSEIDFPNNLTGALVSPNTRFLVYGLTPATEYSFKVVFYSSRKSSVDEIKVSAKTPKEEKEEATFVNCLSAREKEKQFVLKEVVLENGVKGENSAASCGFELEHCVKIIRQLEVS